MRVRATFLTEQTREVEVEVPDDGYTDGDLIEAARALEPFTDFTGVLDHEEING